MPTIRRLDVPIILGCQPPAGQFANAFRILNADSGCVLEFLVYSPRENKAFLVHRIRLSQELLPVIKDQVRCALDPQHAC